jgi:hypothetical protein
VGDVATIVTPNGKRELEILKLTTIHDEAARLKREASRLAARKTAPPAKSSSKDYWNDLDQRFWPRMRLAS